MGGEKILVWLTGRTWGETRNTDGETGWGRDDSVLVRGLVPVWRAPGGSKSRIGEDLRQRVQMANHLDQVHDVGKEGKQ